MVGSCLGTTGSQTLAVYALAAHTGQGDAWIALFQVLQVR